jgi:DNA-binding GntR family transcriptional regulator
VVREAIMRLSSEGILVARQGIGVFVGEQAVNRFEVDWDAIRTLPQTIMVLELCKAIEVEAAALCAARRTRNDAVEIRRLMEKIDAEHADPSSTKVIYDYRFHLAIAKASKSPYIYELLKYMKPIVTPRVKLSSIVPEKNAEKYYEMIHQQHEEDCRCHRRIRCRRCYGGDEISSGDQYKPPAESGFEFFRPDEGSRSPCARHSGKPGQEYRLRRRAEDQVSGRKH